MDTAYAYGANPTTLRDKYYEAEELIVRAWTEENVFSFDGRFTQLRYVNLWPRPFQKPHPPIWVPGSGSVETWRKTIEKSQLYAYLSYSGFKRGQAVMKGFWETAHAAGIDNPYHAGFLQLVCVGESEQEVADKYGPHAEYFFNKMLHIYPGFADPPGYRTIETIKSGLLAQTAGFGRDGSKEATWEQLIELGNVVAGTPEQVTERLDYVIRKLHIGHLMILNQFGSIPHELAKENIRRTAHEVVPNLRHIWSDYEDHWWPQNAVVRESVGNN